mmetsp:Transcript_3285/g.6702  ORF Transcript_3285/g.6702 Transcript_3285/m.6702 type:complete len:268 (+) Transcript_3285:1146-1949(+)
MSSSLLSASWHSLLNPIAMSGIGEMKVPSSPSTIVIGSAMVLAVALPTRPWMVMPERRLLLRTTSAWKVTVMVLVASGAEVLPLMASSVNDDDTTLSGAESPSARSMAAAEIGTSPMAETCTSWGPSCGMLGLVRSNMTVVVSPDFTSWPGATSSTSVPVRAIQRAVALNVGLASRSFMFLSGVAEPVRPEIVIVDSSSPVSVNCGSSSMVMVLVAPGAEVLWLMFLVVNDADGKMNKARSARRRYTELGISSQSELSGVFQYTSTP